LSAWLGADFAGITGSATIHGAVYCASLKARPHDRRNQEFAFPSSMCSGWSLWTLWFSGQWSVVSSTRTATGRRQQGASRRQQAASNKPQAESKRI